MSSLTVSMNMIDVLFNAPFIVQLIMLALIAASIWSWTIIIHKHLLLWKLNNKMKFFEQRFWAGASLDQMYELVKIEPDQPVSEIFMSAMNEWRHELAKKIKNPKNLLDRMEHVMNATLNREVDKLSMHLGFLSSLGTNGVIIGLFGTCIGIINSLQAIAHCQNGSLLNAGIAEALIATAIGLAAAIPAALFYNKFISDIQSLSNRLEDFTQNFIVIISRQIDEEN